MKSLHRFFFILTLLLCCGWATGQVKLPRLVSDGMVLQRDTKVNIWGWATAGEEIRIEFLGKAYIAVTANDGKWSVTLPPQKAGGPFELKVSGINEIVVKDILFGEVWVSSGQSNMELNMRRAEPRYEKIIAESENPNIRFYLVANRYNFNTPMEDLEMGSWQKINPTSIMNCSAVAYFFARELNAKYNVPVGLINASLGGSPVESWISEEGLVNFPTYLEEAKKFRDSKLISEIQNRDAAAGRAWYSKLKKSDKGSETPKWTDPNLDTQGWLTMKLPGYWADGPLGAVNGVVWFRREFNVPTSMAGKKVKLLMGRIVDSDSTYVNGTLVGTTGYQYPPRRYEIPENILKEGKNIITVRVINNGGRGGFVLDKPYQLSLSNEVIDLKGDWQYQLGCTMEPTSGSTAVRWKPMGLYNGEIAPLINYTIKGVIWYQGESNTRKPAEYATLFPTMIKDWRQKWGQGDFPFLFVQLANFMDAKSQPSESEWAELRESQLKTLSLPNTAMTVAIDVGEWNDIHPLNKQDVGKRLALAAESLAYKEKIEYSGPKYESMKISGNKITLTLSHIGKGLAVKGGGELKEFAIAGADKKFVWAKAKIEGSKIVVWSDAVLTPVAVRYAWADNPPEANLINKEGLPASPFQAAK